MDDGSGSIGADHRHGSARHLSKCPSIIGFPALRASSLTGGGLFSVYRCSGSENVRKTTNRALPRNSLSSEAGTGRNIVFPCVALPHTRILTRLLERKREDCPSNHKGHLCALWKGARWTRSVNDKRYTSVVIVFLSSRPSGPGEPPEPALFNCVFASALARVLPGIAVMQGGTVWCLLLLVYLSNFKSEPGWFVLAAVGDVWETEHG